MSDRKIDPDERRSMPRWANGEKASLLIDDVLHPCVVSDMSATGVRLQCDLPLAIGDEVSLVLDGVQPLLLRIVRAQSGSVAAVFVHGPQYLFR